MKRRRVYPSLLQEPLFWGVPRRLLAQEVLLMTLPLQLGFTWRVVLAAIFWAFVVHSGFRFFHSRDPQAFEILADLRNYHRAYQPQAPIHHAGDSPPPFLSIPRRRPWH